MRGRAAARPDFAKSREIPAVREMGKSRAPLGEGQSNRVIDAAHCTRDQCSSSC